MYFFLFPFLCLFIKIIYAHANVIKQGNTIKNQKKKKVKTLKLSSRPYKCEIVKNAGKDENSTRISTKLPFNLECWWSTSVCSWGISLHDWCLSSVVFIIVVAVVISFALG